MRGANIALAAKINHVRTLALTENSAQGARGGYAHACALCSVAPVSVRGGSPWMYG